MTMTMTMMSVPWWWFTVPWWWFTVPWILCQCPTLFKALYKENQSRLQVFLESDCGRKKQSRHRNVGLKQPPRSSDPALHKYHTGGVLAQVPVKLFSTVHFQMCPQNVCICLTFLHCVTLHKYHTGGVLAQVTCTKVKLLLHQARVFYLPLLQGLIIAQLPPALWTQLTWTTDHWPPVPSKISLHLSRSSQAGSTPQEGSSFENRYWQPICKTSYIRYFLIWPLFTNQNCSTSVLESYEMKSYEKRPSLTLNLTPISPFLQKWLPYIRYLLIWHSMFTNQNCSTWRLRFHLKLCSFEGFSTLWVLVFSKHSDFIFPLSQSQSWLQPSVLSCCCLPVPRWSCPTLLPIKELVTSSEKTLPYKSQEKTGDRA